MKHTHFKLAMAAGLLSATLLTAQPAAPAARGGRGGAPATQLPGASAEQQAAWTTLEQGLTPLLQAVTTARVELATAAFAQPTSEADLLAKLKALSVAEQTLAEARAGAFVQLQATPNSLNAAQVQSLLAPQPGIAAPASGLGAAPAARGGRGGRGGGAAGGPNPNRLAGEVAPPPSASLQARVRQLDAILGSASALEESRRIAMDPAASVEARKNAFQIVVNGRDPAVRSMAESLLNVPGLNAVAAAALAAIDAPEIGSLLVAAYPQFSVADRPQLIAALAARRTTAKALLDAVAEGKIPRSEISAPSAQQIAGFNDAGLTRQLTSLWGNLRPSNAEKTQLLERVKADLTAENLAKADPGAGRVVFNNACVACHTIFGTGGNIGPEITGSARGNLEYLLTSITDPSAVVAKDFTVTAVELKDDRSISGLISSETDRLLALKTTTGVVTVQKADIASRRQSELSMMPDGLFQALKEQQIRDLVAYLMSPAQVPLPTNGN